MILFWKNIGPYGCFSNFSRDPIFEDDVLYKTSEHYFQAQKFPYKGKDFYDVVEASTPHQAAQIGRDRNRPLRKDWEEIKDDVMFKALQLKVEQNPIVKATILSSGDEVIVEDSPIDYYWGWGRDHSGKNILGKLWMKLREDLRKEQ